MGARIAQPRLLVTGGAGQLGRWLLARGSEAVEIAAPGRAELDITDAESVAAALQGWRPDAVINAAAYTAVDAAETEPAKAEALNIGGAENIARACADSGTALVHISTDYVLGQYRSGPADTVVEPLPALLPETPVLAERSAAGVYAHTKWRGECAVRAAYPAAMILRTSWVYTGPGREAVGLGGADFVTTMLRLAESQEQVSVVADQCGNPTYAADLADAVLAAALRAAAEAPATRGAVLHASGGGYCSWHDLAQAVFALAGHDPARVRPVTTEEFPRPAARPRWSVLSDAEWRAAGFVPLPPWREALRRAFQAARR